MRRGPPSIPLPSHWRNHVKAGVLHAVALAHRGLVAARGWCADSPLVRVRRAAKLDGLRAEVALLKEEMRLKDRRMARIAPASRPHYTPEERLDVLAVGAARGWNGQQLAERFLVTAVTIATWRRRVRDEGDQGLLRVPDPVNRFPDFVVEVVRRVKATAPAMGKVRIAQVLARAGLHLAPSTASRSSSDSSGR